MRGCVRIVLAASGVALLGACADPNQSPIEFQLGQTKSLVMGGNVRMVTERERYVPGIGALPALCTEPSPDVAIAFGRSIALTAKVTQAEAAAGEGGLNAESTQVATALAGRTAGVLALRDGLYAACQAYANGVIGQNAYAVILSQYGNLLVALAGTGQQAGPSFTPNDARIATLLVSCISEYDPTRLAAVRPDQHVLHNRWLHDVCTALLPQVRSGQMLRVPSAQPPKPAKPTAQNPKPENKDEKKPAPEKKAAVAPPMLADAGPAGR